MALCKYPLQNLLITSGFGNLAPIEATLAVTLGAVTSTETGAVAVAGTDATSLGSLTSTATGTVAVTATESSTLDALTVAGTCAVSVTANLSSSLDAALISATGLDQISGTLAVTLGTLGETASGFETITGSVIKTLGSLTVVSDTFIPPLGYRRVKILRPADRFRLLQIVDMTHKIPTEGGITIGPIEGGVYFDKDQQFGTVIGTVIEL